MSYVLPVFDRLRRSVSRDQLRASCGLHIIDTADKTRQTTREGEGKKKDKIR